jgi:hypothetical protein
MLPDSSEIELVSVYVVVVASPLTVVVVVNPRHRRSRIVASVHPMQGRLSW